MRLDRRYAVSIALLAATIGLTSCGLGLDPSEPAEPHQSTDSMLQAAQEASGARAGQTLARAMALSLRAPAMRGLVRAAMAQSLVKEEKVHFNSYARGPGRALLQAMSRHSGMRVSTLEELLVQAGPLEMYLPVNEHRAAWKGGEELLVAIQYRDHEPPVGFNLSGEPVSLSAEEPPATPTLVLVPAEDFQADGTPTRRGLALGRGGKRIQAEEAVATATFTTSNALASVTVNYVRIPDDYEGWLRGSPEYEFYLERVVGTREQLRCAGAGSDSPFWWNMDRKEWAQPFTIIVQGEVPSPTGLAMSIYEDDNAECVIKEDRDHVKQTVDALHPDYKAIQNIQDEPLHISFSKDTVAGKVIPDGGDEYVGTVTSAGNPIDETERTFSVRNQNTEKAVVKLQWNPLNNPGVVFIHGTGNHDVEHATKKYWGHSTIETLRNHRPYLVVGYRGEDCAAYEECSWGSIVDQIVPWMRDNKITSITVITHSNGANPVRYMLGHPGALSATLNPVQQVTDKISEVIFVAPTLKGTPLADQMTNGTLIPAASSLLVRFIDEAVFPGDSTSLPEWFTELFDTIPPEPANWLVNFLGGPEGVKALLGSILGTIEEGSEPSLALFQQRTDRMTVFNSDGTFHGEQGATVVGGKPISVVRGTRVDFDICSNDAHCGGPFLTLIDFANVHVFNTSYPVSLGLAMTALLGWGSPCAATDGLIGADSSGYFGQSITYDYDRLNHYQSTRGCQGSGDLIAKLVSNEPVSVPATDNPPACIDPFDPAQYICQ